MAAPTLLTRQEIYDLFLAELEAQEPVLTDTNEGSNIDIIAGVTAQIVSEIMRLMVQEFSKTFFDSASGPEVTGGADDLQTLAVDHFGEDFERPGAIKATGSVTFERASTTAGDVSIPKGTIVQTAANANGAKIRFKTTENLTMPGTSITAEVEAETAGTGGNIPGGKIVEIGSTLTDPTVFVYNTGAIVGGSDAENDVAYRETIRTKLQKLRGATLTAIKAAAQDVAGVAIVTAIERTMHVIEYDVVTEDIKAGATPFKLPRPLVYVADEFGTASPDLLDSVQAAIDVTRAAGVTIELHGAAAFPINWTASIALNASGPNFAALSESPQRIVETMIAYIQNLDIGDDFVRADARTAIMDIWGPSGTNDLTDFTTTLPIADVVTGANDKLLPGTVEVES